MVDVFTPEQRSAVMSKIRSSGTTPENKLHLMVRSIIGHRWRIDLNDKDLPGKPDLVVPSLHLVVFADGCFYHQCPKHGRIPDSNREYWEPKLRRNVARDRANRRRLRALGYSVWRVWEHDLRSKAAMARTHRHLTSRLTRRIDDARSGRVTPKRPAAPWRRTSS